MRASLRALLPVVALAVAGIQPVAVAAQPVTADAIDRIFAIWNKPDTPGGALAVVRDGQVVFSRGYGMANLEHGVANQPATVFHAASLSKQFTAFAIHLLAQDGKLSLDDLARKYLPELQLEGDPPITIRHLIHHTSGLRDQWSLLMLAGLRLDDVITDNDILGLAWQQRQLNFAPGEEELYSNTGYSLLGLIVRRVSGQSLAAFAQERIFGPLGMKSTHFHESYGRLVPGRAASYEKVRDGYRYVALSYSNTGATSLFTTVEDLARWNANFDDPRVGGPAAVAAMLVSARLNNGRVTGYAGGLGVAPYRGSPTVQHGGADAGYRAFFLRLPQQRLSVLLLGNAAELNTHDLAHRVADLYLDAMPGVAARKAWPVEIELQARDLAPYVGEYEVRPGGILSVYPENGRLFVQAPGQQRVPLFAAAPGHFFARMSEATLSFPTLKGNEQALTAVWKVGERELPLKRIARATPTEAELQGCAGEYYSAELRTLYHLSVREGRLVVRYPRGVLQLRPIHRDLFTSPHPMGTFVMRRNAQGQCEGFTVTTGRVRNLRFARVNLAPAG